VPSLDDYTAVIAATGHHLAWTDDGEQRRFALWLGDVLLMIAPVNVAGTRPAADQPVDREDSFALDHLLREARG